MSKFGFWILPALFIAIDCRSAEADAGGNLRLLLSSGSPNIEGFANCAFLNAGTTSVPVFIGKETMGAIISSARVFQPVTSVSQALELVKDELTIPNDTPAARRQFIENNASFFQVKPEGLIFAEGAMRISGKTLFWKLLSNTAVLLIDQSGAMVLVGR
jgi:hypothetical protein